MKRIQINFKLSQLLLQDMTDTISTLPDMDRSRFIRQAIIREIKRVKRNEQNKQRVMEIVGKLNETYRDKQASK